LQRRTTVIEFLRAGKSPKGILKLLPYPRRTDYDIATQFKRAEKLNKGSGTPLRKVRSSPRSRRTKNVIKRAQNMILKDPGVSLTKLAAKLNVSLTTMRRIAAEDLRYKSYTLKFRQMLSQDARDKTVNRCKLLLSNIKHETSGFLRFFFMRRYSQWMPKSTLGTTGGLPRTQKTCL
jgi:hypothetical protein